MSQPVLICRPGERGETLADALRASEGWVESLDVMHLEALPEDATQRQVWLDIDQYHKIVVVSPFAAYCLSEALDRYWPQLPIGIDYYSVGRGTASILFDQLGVRVRIPPPQQGEDTSEALLSLASLRHLAHQRVLLVAGEGGRTLIAGKPHAPIYDEAMARAAAVLGRDFARDRVLAIGDGMTTDVKGAMDYGLDLLFISDGIHAREYGVPGNPDPQRLADHLDGFGAQPVATMTKLG